MSSCILCHVCGSLEATVLLACDDFWMLASCNICDSKFDQYGTVASDCPPCPTCEFPYSTFSKVYSCCLCGYEHQPKGKAQLTLPLSKSFPLLVDDIPSFRNKFESLCDHLHKDLHGALLAPRDFVVMANRWFYSLLRSSMLSESKDPVSSSFVFIFFFRFNL